MSNINLKAEDECCGASFEKNNISYIGLITLSYPIFLVLIIPVFLLKLFRINSKLTILFRANNQVIASHKYLSKNKCKISGKLLRYSYWASSLVMNYFHHFLISVLWFFVLAIVLRVFNGI